MYTLAVTQSMSTLIEDLMKEAVSFQFSHVYADCSQTLENRLSSLQEVSQNSQLILLQKKKKKMKMFMYFQYVKECLSHIGIHRERCFSRKKGIFSMELQ